MLGLRHRLRGGVGDIGRKVIRKEREHLDFAVTVDVDVVAFRGDVDHRRRTRHVGREESDWLVVVGVDITTRVRCGLVCRDGATADADFRRVRERFDTTGNAVRSEQQIRSVCFACIEPANLDGAAKSHVEHGQLVWAGSGAEAGTERGRVRGVVDSPVRSGVSVDPTEDEHVRCWIHRAELSAEDFDSRSNRDGFG